MRPPLQLAHDGLAMPHEADAVVTPDPFSDAAPTAPAPATPGPSVRIGFDYGSLPGDTAATLRAAALTIKSTIRQSIRTVGQELIAARALLQHGRFTRWLAAEFGLAARSAENYMALARFLEGKPQSVSDLPSQILYRLAAPSAPAELVADVVNRADAGEPLDRKEIARRLDVAAADRRDRERKAALEAKKARERRRRLESKGVSPEEAQRRAQELREKEKRREEREREKEAREEEARQRRLAPLAEAMVAALSDTDREAVKRVLADYGRDRRALLDLIEARLAAPTAAEAPR